MQISKRLEAVAAMVTPGNTLADIGTDHGYIPIYLAEKGRISRAVAMDVNKGPLSRAVENIEAHELEQVIETRLSDGLAALRPGEAETILIAGMGGPLTVRILTDGADRLEGCRELILQPQSDIRLVRSWLESRGWQIAEEEMVREDGKYYPMMRAVRGGEYFSEPPGFSSEGERFGEAEEMASGRERFGETAEMASGGEAPGRMSEPELRYGPRLLAGRHPVLREFLLREQDILRRILDSLAGQEGDGAGKRRLEVERELELTKEALELFER